jgi:aminoglycoside phosphotransferase (APT) family kinase protein
MTKKLKLSKEVFQQIFLEDNLGIVNSIEELHGGYANPAFLVNDLYVVRFNPDIKRDRKECFLRENILYSLFPKFNIPTPKAIAVNVKMDKIPYYCIINTYIPGSVLSSVYSSFPAEKQHNIAFQLGKLLKKIHTVNLDSFGDEIRIFNWKAPWKDTFLHTFDKTYKEFNEHGNYLSAEDRKTVETIYSEFIHKIYENDIPIGLLHNDFSANHIIIDRDKICGIIDFEWAGFGDPLYDLQKLPINLSIDEKFSVSSFLKGYGLTVFSEKEILRFNMYCLEQGIWMIDRTKHGTQGFPEKGIEQGYRLLNAVTHNRLLSPTLL